MPTLTRTGLCALLGLVALSIGAGLTGHPLLGLCACIAGALLLMSYARLALLLVELKREHLEFTWRLLPRPEPLAGGHAELELRFRNLAPFTWRALRLELVASEALLAEPIHLDLPRLCTTRAVFHVRTPRAGHWVAHGAVLKFEDAAGLFRIAPYCARRVAVKVRPVPSPGAIRLQRGGVQGGARTRRQRGIGTDLREIREHRHGDSFKSIAWKASARRNQLMVREFEAELRVPVVLAVDVSPSMRDGPLGQAPLDEVIRAAHAFAAGALAGGDPVGLVTFSSRRLTELACSSGAAQLARIEDALLAASGELPVEDVHDGRLGQLRAAADFLVKETSLRVKADLSIPGDETLVEEVVERTVEKLRRRGAVDSLPPDAEGRLRVFLRHHGLSPEPARHDATGPRERGLQSALAWAAADPASPRIVLVLSDLGGVHDRGSLARHLARVRGRLRVSVVVPAPRGELGPPGRAGHRARADALLHELVAREERRAMAALCARAGATVLFAPVAGDLRPLLTRAAAARELARRAV